MKPNVHLSTELFRQTIADLISKYNIDTVIESGTNDGTGSTAIFAEHNIVVTTIDADGSMVAKARDLYRDNLYISLNHGYTLSPEHVCPLYHRKLTSNDNQPAAMDFDLLAEILAGLLPSETPLIFLDSHWTQGVQEFFVVLRWYMANPRPFILVLDDATNLKHKPTLHWLNSFAPNVEYKVHERWAIVNFMNKPKI